MSFQGNPITAGERWSLVIFYAVREPDTSRLLKIVKKAADARRLEGPVTGATDLAAAGRE